MSFRPLHDRVLVRRLEQQETTKGGIIIPDTAKEKPMEGTVVAVGTGYISEDGKTRPLAVSVGDTIIFKKWGGDEITVDGQEYLVMEEKNIIGILDNSTAKKKAA
jgi:chaperonin GroES